jgi:hypothetical protein
MECPDSATKRVNLLPESEIAGHRLAIVNRLALGYRVAAPVMAWCIRQSASSCWPDIAPPGARR